MSMLSTMAIEVSFLAGTDLVEAAHEAKIKARLFDVAFIHFNFNGVKFSIGRHADVDRVVEDYACNTGCVIVNG